MVNVPDLSATAGFPAQYSEDITAVDVALVTGHEPAILQVDAIVAASQSIPAYTPVGKDGSGRLVPAISGTTQAIGITIADTDSSGACSSFFAASTSDTITLNRTTTGSVSLGEVIEVEDVIAGTWLVGGRLSGTGVVATPFSAAVS